MGFVASVCQPSTFRMLACPEASSAQNNIAAVSADGSTGGWAYAGAAQRNVMHEIEETRRIAQREMGLILPSVEAVIPP